MLTHNAIPSPDENDSLCSRLSYQCYSAMPWAWASCWSWPFVASVVTPVVSWICSMPATFLTLLTSACIARSRVPFAAAASASGCGQSEFGSGRPSYRQSAGRSYRSRCLSNSQAHGRQQRSTRPPIICEVAVSSKSPA